MDVRRLWLIGLMVPVVAGVALAGWTRHCTRPRLETGIPIRDYQYRSRSASVMALSKTAIPLEREADARRGLQPKEIQLFQWDRPSLQIDHCSISRVALQLHDDGSWVLSLRADQNREPEEPGTPEERESRFQTLHLKRNQFVVKLRCYGAYRLEEPRADETTGKPVLFELGPKRFWVQRAQPKDFWFRGNDDDVRRYFDLVDRVEIELFYH